MPHKIKHFIWRACNDALPTMSNLFRRQVSSSDRCELCQLYLEDPLHALWSCKEVEIAWNSLNCLQQPSHPQPQPQNFCDLLALFFAGADGFRKEVFAISAWMLWNRRNASYFGRPMHPIASIASMAGNLLQEFLIAREHDQVKSQPPISH